MLALGCVAVLALAGVLAAGTAAIAITRQRVEAAALLAVAGGRGDPGPPAVAEPPAAGVPVSAACRRAADLLAADQLELLSCRGVPTGVSVRVAGALPPWLARWGWRRVTAVAVTSAKTGT